MARETDSDSLVEVVLYVREGKNGNVRVLQPEEYDKLEDSKRQGFYGVSVMCRTLTWGLANLLSGHGTKGAAFSPERKLAKIIVAWDIKDGDEDVPVSKETVYQLDTAVAQAILLQYDRISYLSKPEERDLSSRVFNYYNPKNKNSTAPTPPEAVEEKLISEHHWTFKDIDETPYKRIQRFFLVASQRNQVRQDFAAAAAAEKDTKKKAR